MPLSKQELRSELRNRRHQLSNEEQELAAINVANNALELKAFIDAQHIAIYWPHDNEINPLLLMHRALEIKKQCYLPILRVEYKQKLAFASYTNNMPVIKNRYGILEPELPFATLIALLELDVIFTPLVGFDTTGHRLGRGGGFYDATFAELANTPGEGWPYLVGLAYDCQEVRTMPVGDKDWKLDAVVTESRVLKF